MIAGDSCFTFVRERASKSPVTGKPTRRIVLDEAGAPLRTKPKVRIMSAGEMLRHKGRTPQEPYRCPDCGYVHLGNPLKESA